MSLSFAATLAARGFRVELEVAEGETVAVMGPNGAGKSTLLGILAGLVRPDAGAATLAGDTLFAAPADWTPAHRRGVALLAQNALLFPHLSALDNVAFGPRSAGASRSASRATASRWLGEVEAAELAQMRAPRLSGGQQQRVAIARALAADPRLLLLDEPLAALDASVTPTIRKMLRRVLADRTVLLVTHEVLDALALADRVVVMNRGEVVEHGPTRQVLERPQHAFTAELAGLNLLVGIRTASGIETAEGVRLEGTGEVPVGAAAAAAIHPSAVSVYLQHPGGVNVAEVTVRDLEPRGDSIRIRTTGLFTDLPPGRVAALDLAEGDRLFFAVDPAAVLLYRAE